MRPRKTRFFRLGLTVFLTAAAILLFYDTLFGSHVLPAFVGQFLNAAKPIFYGAFMAYLFSPIVNFIESHFFSRFVRKAREDGKFCAPAVRAVSVLLVWLLVVFVVYLLLSVLLPELYRSMNLLAVNLESYYYIVYGWVEKMFLQYPDVDTLITERFREGYAQLQNYITDLLSQVQTIMAAAGRGFLTTMNFLKNLLVGIIVSVYFMTTKEAVGASAKKVVYSLFSRQDSAWILRAVRRADGIFSGFVRGKVLDSFIIGVLCFIGCSVLGFPYTPLVSVFVGVTNIIPFFGPFLGAIPSAFLILLVSPLQAFYFVIFVLALQQLDGNIIGPRILGGQTGLSSLWVIIAILVGGSFFGIPGMFFGVPVLGCLYAAGAFIVNRRLTNAGLPTDVLSYTKRLPAEHASLLPEPPPLEPDAPEADALPDSAEPVDSEPVPPEPDAPEDRPRKPRSRLLGRRRKRDNS